METKEGIVRRFFDNYESTSDADPSLVDYLLGELVPLIGKENVEEAAEAAVEVLDICICEFEELEADARMGVAQNLLGQLSSPTVAAMPSNPVLHGDNTCVAQTNALPNQEAVLCLKELPPLDETAKTKSASTLNREEKKMKRKERRQRTSKASDQHEPSLQDLTIAAPTAPAVPIASPGPASQIGNRYESSEPVLPPTTIISRFFSSHGGSVVDPAMETYFISLVEDAQDESDFSSFLPFVHANAPSLPHDDTTTVSVFIHSLRRSLANEKMLEKNADISRMKATKRKVSQKPVLPLFLQSHAKHVAKQLHGEAGVKTQSNRLNSSAPSPAVRILQEMVPGASAELCNWVLNKKYSGDVSAASLYLVEHSAKIDQLEADMISTLEKKRKEEAKAAKNAEKLEKAMKQATLERYEPDPEKIEAAPSRPVPNSHDRRRFGKHKPKKKKGETEVRWVDGKKINVRRGQTKIMVTYKSLSGKEEWNGGSSGRVIRKSQRLHARR